MYSKDLIYYHVNVSYIQISHFTWWLFEWFKITFFETAVKKVFTFRRKWLLRFVLTWNTKYLAISSWIATRAVAVYSFLSTNELFNYKQLSTTDYNKTLLSKMKCRFYERGCEVIFLSKAYYYRVSVKYLHYFNVPYLL